jgi:hypothetical protein
MFSWSRKLSFRGFHYPTPTPELVRHSASLAASVIIHAQQIVDLDLRKILATDEVLSAIVGAASSLVNLRLTLDLHTLLAAALVSVGTLVSLRSFKIFVHRKWDAPTLKSIHEWASWNFLYLTHLGLNVTGMFQSDFVALLHFLCRCYVEARS